MKKYDVVTIGGALEDINLLVDDYKVIDNSSDPLKSHLLAFEYGAKVGVKELKANFGGGAANAAIAFSKLGRKTATILAVGEDERAKRIIANLIKHNIDVRAVQVIKEQTGASFVIRTQSGEHVLFTFRGANDKLTWHRNVKKVIKKSRRVYLTSLSGSWKSFMNELVMTKVPLAWNPGRKQLAAGFLNLKQYLSLTDILILNRDEATELVLSKKGEIKRTLSTTYLLRKIFSFGPSLVIITEGRKGAHAFDGKKMYAQKSTAHKAIDTTGVGDAFGATFVASLDKHNDISRALKAAMRNSGSVVTKMGAQHGLLTYKELSL